MTNKKSCHSKITNYTGELEEEGGLDPDPDRKNTEIVDDAGGRRSEVVFNIESIHMPSSGFQAQCPQRCKICLLSPVPVCVLWPCITV